jgi:hypothetical protein
VAAVPLVPEFPEVVVSPRQVAEFPAAEEFLREEAGFPPVGAGSHSN